MALHDIYVPFKYKFLSKFSSELQVFIFNHINDTVFYFYYISRTNILILSLSSKPVPLLILSISNTINQSLDMEISKILQ